MGQSQGIILSEKNKKQNNIYNFYVRGEMNQKMFDLGKMHKELIKIFIE